MMSWPQTLGNFANDDTEFADPNKFENKLDDSSHVLEKNPLPI